MKRYGLTWWRMIRFKLKCRRFRKLHPDRYTGDVEAIFLVEAGIIPAWLVDEAASCIRREDVSGIASLFRTAREIPCVQ